jgi:hypothetical protein
MAGNGRKIARSRDSIPHQAQVRFRGGAGEQATMFFADPSGNALEIKAFADDAMVFAR